mgnify:CR=1 FL=1
MASARSTMAMAREEPACRESLGVLGLGIGSQSSRNHISDVRMSGQFRSRIKKNEDFRTRARLNRVECVPCQILRVARSPVLTLWGAKRGGPRKLGRGPCGDAFGIDIIT